MRLFREAAANGDLQLIKTLHDQMKRGEKGLWWDDLVCKHAASNGHLDCLKYLHENGCQWYEDTCSHAALNGHLDCLKYAHEQGCSWNEDTCAFAARNGHLECLKYAYEQECPWDEWTCANAALNGHLDCLTYAHNKGCQWDVWTCSLAAEAGHLNCLTYARENGCPWDQKTCIERAAKCAFKHSNLTCFQYLHEEYAKQHDFQSFWNLDYDLSYIEDQIDLDNPYWRKSLFNIDLSSYPALQERINCKKKEIKKTKKKCAAGLKGMITNDVIQHCLFPFF